MRAFENRIVYNGPQVASYDGAIAGLFRGYPDEGTKVI
jgi:hypothetical protein